MLLHRMFIKSARKHSKKIAVFDQATGQSYTYGRMLIAGIMLAGRFQKIRSVHVGVMLPTSFGCMLVVLATLMTRKTPVMINYSTGAAANCRYAQNKCSFRTIVTSRKLLEKLECEHVQGMIYVEDILKSITLIEKLKAALISKLPLPLIYNGYGKGSQEDTAAILFTSGSESDPKAVMLAHRNILQNYTAALKVFHMNERDVFLANLPLFHVFGLTVCMWIPLCLGCSITAQANPLDYKTIVNAIREYGVTIMVGTPTFYHGYLKRSEPGDFVSVRLAMAGADKLAVQIREEYIRVHNLEVMEGYGTTETSPIISANLPGINKPGSVGKPFPGVRVRIVDRETEQDLPVGKEGKIVVKGDLVMKGYFNDLEETSRRIRNGWYETGDMGVMDEDGYLWHRGRLKRFVKIGGEMVSLVKVEAVLENMLPEGALCCVVDVPNPRKGSDIIAAVTTTGMNYKHIKKQMSKHLPAIAIPKDFIELESLPLMSSGKVNFREVEQICRSLVKNGD